VTVSDPLSEPVEVSVLISATPETVFAYFTDPARYVRWMGSQAELDPVPGGAYRVFMREGVEAAGEFVAVDPPHRIEFTWGWSHDHAVAPGSTRVVVTLIAEGGGTRVRLRHYDLPDNEQREHHRQGWAMYLGRLEALRRGADPGPDPNG
jgi:uncharacterized protein YndB with AHSA1/START domain